MWAAANLFGGAAFAQVSDDDAPKALRYVLGASVRVAPEYAGSSNQVAKLRPVWALEYGRYRISPSGAGTLLGFGVDDAGPGASAELLRTSDWKFGVALRWTTGRPASASPFLTGLPDVRSTLLGRAQVSYRLAERWSLAGNVTPDLLGRGSGAVASLGLGYRQRLLEGVEWTVGSGIEFGDRRHMQSNFGIDPAASLASGLPAFNAGAGIKDLNLGTGLTVMLARRWVAFGGIGTSRLLGDAAASPVTRDRNASFVSIGLAYRCCR